MEREIIAFGGEYHINGEQLLINNGSKTKNIWGGGRLSWQRKDQFFQDKDRWLDKVLTPSVRL